MSHQAINSCHYPFPNVGLKCSLPNQRFLDTENRIS
jgi:hypothetical protein